MEVVRTIAPGKRGSIRYLKEWGDQLVTVRYRKNMETNQMLTTIEIVVDQRPLPVQSKSANQLLKAQAKQQQYVALKINYHEVEYRHSIKKAGGSWSKQMKMWVTHRDTAERLGLSSRIVEGAVEMCVDVDPRSIKLEAYI